MAMPSASISAIYEDGFLKLMQPLALPERQRVRVIVMPVEPDPARVRWMHEQADDWLAQQPADAVREPVPLSAAERARLDAEFDSLLADMRRMTTRLADGEVAASVDNAWQAGRRHAG